MFHKWFSIYIDQKNLEYVQYQDVDGRYTLSENEIEQFIEYVRQIRVYPMPGNLHYETREFKFYYKYLGQSEEKILQLTSEFVKYNNEIFHVGENYWRLYNEELKLWCYSLKKWIGVASKVENPKHHINS